MRWCMHDKRFQTRHQPTTTTDDVLARLKSRTMRLCAESQCQYCRAFAALSGTCRLPSMYQLTASYMSLLRCNTTPHAAVAARALGRTRCSSERVWLSSARALWQMVTIDVKVKTNTCIKLSCVHCWGDGKIANPKHRATNVHLR